ncbi:gliding motility-associated C-terminal domain-containing protein [Spirosoma aerolatum]|uniref:gliding motility-associated C-terminal domain-containing protein n=1 Tax=Spirosoma aerolatum TaxID=1211326 RepID=UPI001FEAD2BE|nr:gliding motility-associated C-terminal domain-containing protein [Spirosoma aerolatum]
MATSNNYSPADTCLHPEPPIITGSAKAICRNEVVSLTATGCSGTVIWSNGDTGPTISVKPQQTTKYTAICRAKPGCISCFADVWKITVNTPEAPTVTTSSKLVCPGQTVTLTATNCTGTVHWISQDGSEQTVGKTWTTALQTTTAFRATCEQNNCTSNPSIPRAVEVAAPQTPVVTTDRRDICAGQTIRLTASGCLGNIRWTDGAEGLTRTVTPYSSINYRAICQIGSCQSDSSQAVSITVRSASNPLNLQTKLTSNCPFQTVDLSKAIINKDASIQRYEFRTEASLLAPAVQSPGAVGAGTYYLFGRTVDGCYTEPIAIVATIKPCQNAIPPCLSNPAFVAIRLDSLDPAKGVVRLTAQLGGSANNPSWQSDGGGLFTNTETKARYLLSEADRQRGATLFTVSIADPDGDGPCVGASAQKLVMTSSRELVGLSKKVAEPIWLTENQKRLVELTYQLTVANLGKQALTGIQLADDLDAAFSGAGAQIQSVNVRVDSDLVINKNYTGLGTDTILVTGGTLQAGEQAHAWLTVRLDVSQANTLTFTNKAMAQAVDATGNICRDRSTNGLDTDPDQNGNPADNDEPTVISLHSVQGEDYSSVFIPEGFSPNGDGVNDRFVIQNVPTGITIQVEIYNRWGHLVYQNMNYKNDWDGTSNQGVKTADSRQGLPDGTYYYQIRLSDGREFVRFLTLVR